MHSTTVGVNCEIAVDGMVVEPDAFYEATWNRRRSWPANSNWEEVEQFSIFKMLQPD